jgi:hypothetical protein
MRHVADVAEGARAAGDTVLTAATDVERVTGALRCEVDAFFDAMRQDEGNRRQHARFPGNGTSVGLRLRGGPAATVELIDLSRDGAALASDLEPALGAEVDLTLPGADGAVAAEVTRVAGGIVCVAFRQDPASLARVELAATALQARMQTGGSVPLAA